MQVVRPSLQVQFMQLTMIDELGDIGVLIVEDNKVLDSEEIKLFEGVVGENICKKSYVQRHSLRLTHFPSCIIMGGRQTQPGTHSLFMTQLSKGIPLKYAKWEHLYGQLLEQSE
jgi:hypothetical protein